MTYYSKINPVSVNSSQSIQQPAVTPAVQEFAKDSNLESQKTPVDNKADKPMTISEIPTEVIKAFYLSQLNNQDNNPLYKPKMAYRD